jgi:hypothetical protein
MAHSIISCLKTYLIAAQQQGRLFFYIPKLNDSRPYLLRSIRATARPNKAAISLP